MRRLILAAAIAALAAPAAADTLQEVTTRGIVILVGDMQIDVTYTPDGKFTAAQGQIFGAWQPKTVGASPLRPSFSFIRPSFSCP